MKNTKQTYSAPAFKTIITDYRKVICLSPGEDQNEGLRLSGHMDDME